MFYTNIVVIASNKSRAETQSIKKGKQKNVIENHRNKMTERNKGKKKKKETMEIETIRKQQMKWQGTRSSSANSCPNCKLSLPIKR